MPLWRPSRRTVINSKEPLGIPVGGKKAPFADLSVEMPAGNRGGWHRSSQLKTLTLTHAVQCRVLREFDRLLFGNAGIADRMNAYHVGYDERVYRVSVEAVETVTGDDAASFDKRIKILFDALQTSDRRKSHLGKQREVTNILYRAKRDAARLSQSIVSFKRTNYDSGKRPGFKRILATFLSRPSSVDTRGNTIIDDMLTIATYGLVNPATLYQEFDYLRDPLWLAVGMGIIGVYNCPSVETIAETTRLRAIIDDGSVPASIKGSRPHEDQYFEVCRGVQRAWDSLKAAEVIFMYQQM